MSDFEVTKVTRVAMTVELSDGSEASFEARDPLKVTLDVSQADWPHISAAPSPDLFDCLAPRLSSITARIEPGLRHPLQTWRARSAPTSSDGLAAIIAFIEARLAEDRAAADGLMFACRDPELTPDFTGSGGPCAETFWNQFTAARMLREVEAKQAILRRCQARMNEPDQWPNGLVSPRALLARQTLMDLAVAWSRHTDYQPGWKP